METEPEPEHDPRYARTREIYVVISGDRPRDEEPEAVCATRKLADQYIAGQWEPEYCRVKAVPLVEELPPQRDLFMLTGTLPYPDGEPSQQLDEYKEFPGLGNGSIVPLDEVKAELSNTYDGGWNINVTGWDRLRVEAEFDRLAAQAKETRAACVAAFSGYPMKSLVGRGDGEVLYRTTRLGVPCWQVLDTNKIVHDRDLSPTSISLLREGERPQ